MKTPVTWNTTLSDSYMKVEDVLRYLNLKNNAFATQYTIEGQTNNFFKCSDVKAKIGEREFRVMQCEVIQYITNLK